MPRRVEKMYNMTPTQQRVMLALRSSREGRSKPDILAGTIQRDLPVVESEVAGLIARNLVQRTDDGDLLLSAHGTTLAHAIYRIRDRGGLI